MDCVACGMSGAGNPDDCGLCIKCGIGADAWEWPEATCIECDEPVENGDDEFCVMCWDLDIPSRFY